VTTTRPVSPRSAIRGSREPIAEPIAALLATVLTAALLQAEVRRIVEVYGLKVNGLKLYCRADGRRKRGDRPRRADSSPAARPRSDAAPARLEGRRDRELPVAGGARRGKPLHRLGAAHRPGPRPLHCRAV